MANRLEGSASPYLRQHADDPVDWMPWGDEAFALAEETGRPILLSCGYSACHWCHVMQRESFKDPETAAFINEHFVAVKVDRELRPDIDAVYQDYVTASSGLSGWPLTVWLTPSRLPVYGGTYFPHQARPGEISFPDALEAVARAWRDDRADVERTAAGALAFLRQQVANRPEGPVNRSLIDYAADAVVGLQDLEHGGMKGKQKFPQLAAVEFQCAYAKLLPDVDLLRSIESTMLAIVRGGIFDQVGGGMHRYATDEAWRMPHFEKMLPDQGMLLSALAAASPWASSDAVREEYAHAARATAAFLAREMALAGGGYAASLSAETRGVEGATYTWTHDQLAEALDPTELARAVAHLGAGDAGDTGPFTLHRPAGRVADADAVDAVLATLAAVRAERPQPDVDTKLITSWNAIAARGLMDAGTAFGDDAATNRGVALARLLAERTVRDDGVVREPSDPSVARVRLLEDAAHLVAALLTAHAVTGETTLLEDAQELHYQTLELFSDAHVLFATPADTDLPVRPREGGDGAVPSGASAAIESSVRLGTATGDAWFYAHARGALEQMWGLIDFAPEQAGRALTAATMLEIASQG